MRFVPAGLACAVLIVLAASASASANRFTAPRPYPQVNVTGEATAAYLDRVVSLTTVVGAVYLTALQVIPGVFDLYGIGLPYSMVVNGGAALVVVCTALDIKAQVRDVSLTNPGGVRR